MTESAHSCNCKCGEQGIAGKHLYPLGTMTPDQYQCSRCGDMKEDKAFPRSEFGDLLISDLENALVCQDCLSKYSFVSIERTEQTLDGQEESAFLVTVAFNNPSLDFIEILQLADVIGPNPAMRVYHHEGAWRADYVVLSLVEMAQWYNYAKFTDNAPSYPRFA